MNRVSRNSSTEVVTCVEHSSCKEGSGAKPERDARETHGYLSASVLCHILSLSLIMTAGGCSKQDTKPQFVRGTTVVFDGSINNAATQLEFEKQWQTKSGATEIVDLGGEKWIAGNVPAIVAPRLSIEELPEAFTLEIEFYSHGSGDTNSSFGFTFVSDDTSESVHLEVLSTDRIHILLHKGGKGSFSIDKWFPEPFLSQGTHTLQLSASPERTTGFFDGVSFGQARALWVYPILGIDLTLHPGGSKVPILLRNLRITKLAE